MVHGGYARLGSSSMMACMAFPSVGFKYASDELPKAYVKVRHSVKLPIL